MFNFTHVVSVTIPGCCEPHKEHLFGVYASEADQIEEGSFVLVHKTRDFNNSDLAKVVSKVSLEPTDVDAAEVALEGEVMTVVDLTNFYNRREASKKMKVLKKQMEERAKKLQDIALFEMLAKDDEDMKALITEYKNILGGV